MKALLPFLALYRRHWFRLTLGMALAIVTILASIGLLTLSGWFLAASALAGLAGLLTFNYMLPAAGVRGSAIIRTAARYAERLASHDATFRVLAHLRTFTFQKILPLSPGAIARFRQAELLNRLVADVDTLDHLYLRLMSPLVSAVAVILVVTIGLSVLDVFLALTLGGIMLALLCVIPTLFYRTGKPIGVALTSLRSDYRGQLTAWLQGQAELAVFGALGAFRHKLDDTERQWLTQQKKQARLNAASQSLMTLASGLTFILILWLAAAGVGGDTHPGAYIALFVFISLAAFEALAPVAGAFLHLGQVMSSAERVHQIIEQKPEVEFPTQKVGASPQAALSVQAIEFTYRNQPFPVLKDIDFHVNAGEHVALLGRTGCGKSTLLQLLTRAWDPQHGQITLNGRPLADYDEATLRDMMVVVTQRVHIFSATLRDNLKMAAPNADDARLSDVLERVGLGALLAKEGLNAWLGEGGRPLSGGEQRRIGLARVLLHGAPLVLLDEPTEGLDADTEKQILLALRTHCREKTVILITHRLSDLDHMDKIYVMDEGRIVEQGNHETLLAQKGQYYRFHQR
ncbi:cysteine/glutathione ABC transporter ATP-binding protein/permease CydC [Leminorella grimontii]|uniref:Glutathione/L-cysteine transport system ATP-binding/permease protein CydC n=1 Tax=Leminorella grimontii TaxID=82981 RepID=A0AAV5N2V1_9GAMM|nr:cysteine/glutathione ABC transporter ATP-binding protein/permease CydC [Leminorella grimontii]KFC96948.1 CydC family ATP-binding transport protein [Leminorella grimontii ATCC 33999 = DSM 5078]GKX56092.1 cysteine/glutathione ABC transporter ATP-binding protein/permease CydC [Leminorella grimontii]VFS57898.1 Putative multidrug export ATP-binding/permease protein SAV1866 [Leminorella grimontii]